MGMRLIATCVHGGDGASLAMVRQAHHEQECSIRPLTLPSARRDCPRLVVEPVEALALDLRLTSRIISQDGATPALQGMRLENPVSKVRAARGSWREPDRMGRLPSAMDRWLATSTGGAVGALGCLTAFLR